MKYCGLYSDHHHIHWKEEKKILGVYLDDNTWNYTIQKHIVFWTWWYTKKISRVKKCGFMAILLKMELFFKVNHISSQCYNCDSNHLEHFLQYWSFMRTCLMFH